MTYLLAALDWILPAAYVALWILHMRAFFKKESDSPDAPLKASPLTAKPPLYLLLALHALYTVLRGLAQQAWPMGSPAEFFSILALSVFAVWLFSSRRDDDSQTGPFFLGIASSFQVIASMAMIPVDQATHPILLENPVYGVHVLFTVLGFAALAVGALHAVMYILLSRQLKARELGLFFQRLPPLIQLEEMSRAATTAGILLLGVGLTLGHFVALYVLESFNPWDPKIVLTDLAWLAYLVGLILIKLKGLGGLRIGYLSLIAFVLLMTTVLLSNLIFSSFHSFSG